MTDEQFFVIVALLTDIRDGLVSLATEEPAPDGCAHPEEKRVSLATVKQPEHWVCAVCRYDHPGLTMHS